jgi:hypothetical protein
MRNLCKPAAVVLLVGLAFVLPGRATATEPWQKSIPYLRLLEKYGAYEPLLDLMLEPVVAAERTKTVIKVALETPQARAKLEVYRFDGRLTVEGGDSSYLGDNWVKMQIPVEFRYEIDLALLKSSDVQYDAARNVLEVRLPPVRMAKVNADYTAVEVLEKHNPFLRSRAGWYELKEDILYKQVRPGAESLGEEKLSEANLVARGVAHDLFRRLYAPVKGAGKDLVIVVK